jgi:hypothetical protein
MNANQDGNDRDRSQQERHSGSDKPEADLPLLESCLLTLSKTTLDQIVTRSLVRIQKEQARRYIREQEMSDT